MRGATPWFPIIVKDSWLSKFSIAREFTGKNWLGGTTVRVGVNNVFNAEPPFGLGAATDTDGYLRGFGDPRGRAYYLEVSRKF
jgi:outer membrane receptor protein involved in Fe transport